MWRLLIIGCSVTVLTGAAHAAAKLRVSGTYGSATTCSLYAEGGSHAVFSAGGSLGRNITLEADLPDFMIITANEIVGFEWACTPEIVEGTSAVLVCEAAGEKPEPVNVVIDENPSRGDVTYTDEIGSLVLPRCADH